MRVTATTQLMMPSRAKLEAMPTRVPKNNRQSRKKCGETSGVRVGSLIINAVLVVVGMYACTSTAVNSINEILCQSDRTSCNPNMGQLAIANRNAKVSEDTWQK